MQRLILLLLAALPFSHAADPTLVTPPAGPVTGINLGATYAYEGIPYAAAPVGRLRWASPAPHAPWKEPLAAKAYGERCPQMSFGADPRFVGSEDCLFLNVWRPAAPATKLPVMVFLHGGANSIGSAADELYGVRLYDGHYLSEHGPAVVVTLNYRLGALGFLAHSALSGEDSAQASGNYGLLDQIQALRWVKENIAAFGGDPANVTLFGESAGAIDTLALFASPLAEGLFQRAIVESGFLTERPLAAAEEAGEAFAKAAGCTGAPEAQLTCLRALSPEQLVRVADKAKSSPLAAFSLTVDGFALPAPVLDSIRARRGGERALLIGTNADEMTTLGPAIANTDKIDTPEKFEAAVRASFGAAAPAVLAAYPLSEYTSPRNAIESLLADLSTHCPSRRIARAVQTNGENVWRYVFAHVSDSPILAPFGAAHAFELPYVFHNLNSFTTTPREEALSAQIAESWLAFARNGNPGAAWAPFRGDEIYRLDIESSATRGFRAKQCDFLDTLAPDQAEAENADREQ